MQLHEYWPDFLAELTEFEALAEAQQPELTAALVAARALPEDFYIQTLTGEGAARWERLLGMPVLQGGALEERRFRIMARTAEQRPFTLRWLRELLTTLCGEDGFSVSLVGADFRLVVRLALAIKQNYDDVQALLGRIVPVNMVIDLSILYIQYQALASYTHEQLANYTHEQLRNEVI